MYFQGVRFSSEGGGGCFRDGVVVVVDVFIESNLLSSLSIYPWYLYLSTNRVGDLGIGLEIVSFLLIS